MPRWLAELLSRPFRPLASAALVALAPKCAMCVVAYAGLGALLGMRTPEICGAAAGSRVSWLVSAAWICTAIGAMGLLAALGRLRNSLRRRRFS